MPTSTKCFRTGWRVDSTTTYIDSTVPFIFERNIAINTPVTIILKDDQYDIALSSIELYINGWAAINASIVTNISGGYSIKYTPTIDWYWNSRVNIRVEAANDVGISMLSYQYYFDVVARKIGAAIEQAVLEISRETSWDNL